MDSLCHDPLSKACCERKPAQGKKRDAGVICLARGCCDDVFAMLNNGTLYQAKAPQTA